MPTPRLNLTQPALGDTSWKTDVDQWADKLDEAAAQYLGPFHIGGVAIDEEVIFDGLFFDEAVDITKVTIYAREAPSGAPFTVAFTKDGTEQSKTATLNDGAKKQATAITGLSYTTLQEFGLKVKSVGTTDPGAEIAILVHYHVQAVV